MTIALIILGVALASSLATNIFQQIWATQERKDLTDRVMALSQPISLVTHRAPREPADVEYIDERREFELSPPQTPESDD